MAEYVGRLPLFHIDLYRLADASDALAGGLIDDRQAGGVTLVEWPDRLGPALPLRRLDVIIDGSGDEPRCDHHACQRSVPAALPGHRWMSSSTHDGRRAAILAFDTATTQVVVASGSPSGRIDGLTTWTAGYRHGETLLASIGRFLGEQNIRRSRLTGIVVGTGPGAFTGLRVGLATAKGLAHGLGLPLVGISTGEALLAAATAAGARTGRAGPPVLLLPAGPSDRIVVRPGTPPALLPAGLEPDLAPDEWLVAIDLEDRADADALERGAEARAGLGATLVSAGAARLAARDADDLAGLEPEYVTLPRGVTRGGRGGVVVARPPMILRIEPMRIDDLPAVHEIERASFDAPWPPEAYRNDLETNRLAQYLVARVGDEVAAYRGMWLMVDEGHIITFAVHPAWRRQHIGERLLIAFLDLALERGAHEATLEVRLSNLPARRLYEKFGFRPVGLRPRYYSDNGEDALIMTTEPLADAPMRERIARLRAAVDAAPAPSRPETARMTQARPETPGRDEA